MPRDRRSPDFWRRRVEAHRSRTRRERQEFHRFYRRYAAGNHDLSSDRFNSLDFDNDDPVEANMTNLVTRVGVSEMFFRNPRVVVRPVETFGGPKFTPALAKVEERLLQDMIEETDYFDVGRQVLTDAHLGWMGVLEVSFSAEIVQDLEEMERQRRAAENKIQSLLLRGRMPRVNGNEMHSVYIEEIEHVLGRIQEGVLTVPVTESVVKTLRSYLKRHREFEKREMGRSNETARNQHVWLGRVNPATYYYDDLADTPAQRRWVGKTFMRPIEEVQSDPLLRAEFRKTVTTSRIRNDEENVDRSDTFAEDERLVRMTEILDLEEGRVITFASDGGEMARDEPWPLFPIMPSGRYVEVSFMRDHDGYGIAPPRIYEGHQVYLQRLMSLVAATANRSIPRFFFNSQVFGEDALDALRRPNPGEGIGTEKLAIDADIRRSVIQFPGAKIDPQVFAAIDQQIGMIERTTGKGAVRLGGGDTSRTATASQLVNQSSGVLSDDTMAVWRNAEQKALRLCARIIRRMYPPKRVAELVGDGALEHWPPPPEDVQRPNGFSDRDIKNDRGISVVPGSSQRRDIGVEQKLMSDLLNVIGGHPILAQIFMSRPDSLLEILQRLFESFGLSGIDLTGAEQQIQQALALQQAQAAAQAAPPQQGGETSEGGLRPADLVQALQNSGGGRVPTGASQGDNQRLLR